MIAFLNIYLAVVLIVGVGRLIFNYRFLTIALLALTFPISGYVLAAITWKSNRKKAITLIVALSVAILAFTFLYALTKLPAA